MLACIFRLTKTLLQEVRFEDKMLSISFVCHNKGKFHY